VEGRRGGRQGNARCRELENKAYSLFLYPWLALVGVL
jgi:hypothetical protein